MRNISILILTIILAFPGSNLFSQTEKISYRGYEDCYRISNDSVEVIIVAGAGARILRYSLKDRNIIYEDPALDGKTLEDFLKKSFGPDGARFDVRGVTSPGNKRDTLWIGPYTAEITGNYSVKTTSMVDHNMGIDITREFFLDSISSHLLIRQTMTNKSNLETNWYFWGRIFSPIGGKIIIPLNPNSKFGSRWGYYNGSDFISENAQDPLIETSDSLLFYRADITGTRKRYGIDSDQGLIIYGYNEQLYVIKFNIDLSKTYLTESGETIIVFTDGELLVELEPTSPVAKLNPGESFTFEENWWLFSYPEAQTKDFDGPEAVSFVMSNAVAPGNALSRNNEEINKESHNSPAGIHVFPNPAGEKLTIIGNAVSSAELYTVTGKIIYSKKFTGKDNDFTLSTGSIPKGVYFVKIFTGGQQDFVTRKVIIIND